MKNGFRLYDAHTHAGIAAHSGRRCAPADLLREMDRCGVDRALVIPFPVVDDMRAAHDLIGAAKRQHPDRFTGAACYTPAFSKESFRDEVRRCREVHDFRAVKLQPQYHGLNPFSPRSDFLFEAALEHKMAVVCHTGAGAPFALPSLLMVPARRFPELNIVVAHCGGGIYFQEAVVAATFCPNLFLELSSLLPHQVLEVLTSVPSSRIMAGSDLLENTESEMGKILTLPIADEDKRAILFSTAERVFGSC